MSASAVLSSSPPLPGTQGDMGTAAPDAPAPCAAWSQHAADLASSMAPLLEAWPQNPATQALVLRGELLRMRAGLYVPAGACDSAVDRAIAVGCAIGTALRGHHVIAGRSASWVLQGGTPPDPMELISRSHRTVIAGAVTRQCVLEPDDVEVLGGAPITVPGRTATDLLRRHPAHISVPAVEGLLRTGHLDIRDVERRLARLHGAPGTRGARRLLAQIRAPQGGDGSRAAPTAVGGSQA